MVEGKTRVSCFHKTKNKPNKTVILIVATYYLVLTHCRLVAKDTAERSRNSFIICKDKKISQ
jgi:hypothetical protein